MLELLTALSYHGSHVPTVVRTVLCRGVQDWGEQMHGARSPKLFVASFQRREIKPVPGAPEGIPDFTAGHPTFTPDGKGIVYVAWNNQPRRLGIIFCHNRPSALFLAPNPLLPGSSQSSSVADTHLQLSSDWMALSPSFSPKGDSLYYLASGEEGPHRFASRLQRMPWPLHAPSTSAEVVVNKVQRPKHGDFPGLYCDDIHSSTWTADGSAMLLHTFYGSRHSIVRVPVSGPTPVTPVDVGRGASGEELKAIS